MTRLLLIGLIAVTVSFAQYAPSASGSTTAAAEINSKMTVQISASAASGNCTAGKDIWVNTTLQTFQFCGATNTWGSPCTASSPNGSITIGANCTSFDVDTSYLNTLYAQLAVGGTFLGKMVFTPTSTTAGERIVVGNVPSSLAAGDLFVSSGGVFGYFDGSLVQAAIRVAGSSSALPAAWNGTRCLHSSGTAFDITEATTDCVLGTSTPQTFAALPTCAGGVEGRIASVTDSNTATWGATIAGSSTNHVLAYCNGTNWTVAGK